MSLRFGIVSEMNFETGLARVEFKEDGIVSQFLPVLVPNTKDVKFKLPVSIGEQVACLMDEHAERGVILGAVYSKADTPNSDFSSMDPQSYGVTFPNGVYIEVKPNGLIDISSPNLIYIRSNQSIEMLANVHIVGDLTIDNDVFATNMQAAGEVSAAGGTINLTTHTHIGNLGSPTGPALPG